MTICEYCIEKLFREWHSADKQHHTDAAAWQDSIKQCTICSSLLDTVGDAIIKSMGSQVPKTLDTFGMLGALPIYDVTRQESAARDQYLLIFRPNEENVKKMILAIPFKTIQVLALPVRKFQVYATSYDNADIPRLSNETFLDARENKRNTRTLNQIKDWIVQCDNNPKNHKHCGHFNSIGKEMSFVPTRLIEVRKQGDDDVRLVETHGNSDYRRYASLSHCWGGFIAACTKDDNYEKYKDHIPVDKLPRNFLEAIKLCRILGIEYIWIDSLCIIQNQQKEKDTDFSKEVPRMHEVYGSSYLNIAAASACNSNEGLFRKRRINLLSPSIVPCVWQGRNRYCKVIQEDFWSGELLEEPLYRRAWVTQERMLAPRTIHFGTKQLFWQCLTMNACETMPKGIPSVVHSAGQQELKWRRLLQKSRLEKGEQCSDKDKRTSKISQDDRIELQEVWRDAVRNYTSCNITKTIDKLPAFAGLAQVMYDCCEEDYVAGLWRQGEQLVLQMAWRVKDCRTGDGKPSRRQRPDEYRAPTWAWPSVVEGVIEIPRRIRIDEDTTISLELTGEPQLELNEKNSTAPGREFMALEGGWLNATGSLYEVPFSDTHDPETTCWCWYLPGIPDNERPWVYMYPDEPLLMSEQAFPWTYDGRKSLEIKKAGEASSAHEKAGTPDVPLGEELANVNDGGETANSTDGEKADSDQQARNFTILPLFFKKDFMDDEEYYSGRALAVQEVEDPAGYKCTPQDKDKHAMFTRIGLVEFRKVHESLWRRFQGVPYPVNHEGEGRVALTLL